MVNNGELYTQVMEKLKFEPNIDESNITVSIKEDGIVVLGGCVETYSEKYLAQHAVEKLEKVHGIANELTVHLSSIYKRSDADIVKSALETLRWTVLVPHDQIKVVVDNGIVTLSGHVSYYYQKQRAYNALMDLYGVKHINNNIVVQSDIKPEDVKEKIIREFERNARIDAKNVQVEVNENRVILRGNVKNFDEAREARNAAWSVSGVIDVEDHLLISR
jgi:osmotically-inducible protein OsmY